VKKSPQCRNKSNCSILTRGNGSYVFEYSTTWSGGALVNVQVCEHAFFVALGGGKTNQWYRAMRELVHGKADRQIEKGESRAAFKAAQVRAYISVYISSCEIPPGRNLGGMRILPFPNVEQFYQEYCLSFQPSFLRMLR
jgi:hypothetical protein